MNDHYFSPSEAASSDDQHLLRVNVRGQDLQMWVTGRVFSSTRLDPGTAELLRALPPLPPTGNFLDLGCGWGPVAVILAKESPDAEVWAVDVNPRALALTRGNSQVNDAGNILVLPADVALGRAQTQGVEFDRIVTNPPVRIGKKEMHQMLRSWFKLLSPSGEAWIVMGKNLGGDSLVKWLHSEGYLAEKVASRKGYRIIRATPCP